jgi:hypothetical protein
VGTVTITIAKFKEYNARSDVKKSSWYRKEHSLIFHPDWAHFTAEEMHVWDTLLALASYVDRETYTYSLEQLAGWCRVKLPVLLSAIEKLIERESIEVVFSRDADVTRAEHKRSPTNERTNERTRTLDFESLYSKYPNKKGKAKGMKTCRTQIKTPEDFERLSKAIDRYAKECLIERVEKKFIKHFSTFMGCWTDYDTGPPQQLPLEAKEPDTTHLDSYRQAKEAARLAATGGGDGKV